MDRLIILGCGFTGTEVARRALAAGARVLATTRDPVRAESLRALGIDARAGELSPGAVRDLLTPGAAALVAFPPDDGSDRAVVGALERAGARVVYVSSTAVYGAARGRVDEQTPLDPSEAAGRARIDAERRYLGSGAAVVRAAGIYGPFRGLHRRLLAGSFRVVGSGANVVSRIHVADLARMVLALFAAPEPVARGAVYVAADDAAVPQIEVIRWLCERLRLPLPDFIPASEAAPSLRHDRAIDSTRIRSALALALDFPSYREGFEACLAAEGVPRGVG